MHTFAMICSCCERSVTVEFLWAPTPEEQRRYIGMYCEKWGWRRYGRGFTLKCSECVSKGAKTPRRPAKKRWKHPITKS